jgi:hypothetical protein
MILFLSLSFSLTAFAQDDLAPASAAAAASTAAPSVLKKEMPEKWEQEQLRDPFWPIGFFPPNWQRKPDPRGSLDAGDAGGWTAASAKLRISGTSQLGDRTVAIINGELKSVGEQVDVLYEGKRYQWEIIGIGANGQIQLKKMGIR